MKNKAGLETQVPSWAKSYIPSSDFSYVVGTEVFARNHSILQAYQPGAAKEVQLEQPGCRHLRCGLQGAGIHPSSTHTLSYMSVSAHPGLGLCHIPAPPVPV